MPNVSKKKRKNFSAAVKYFVAAYLGAAFYCEWVVYRLQPSFWPELRCQDDAACTRILFIADPQIQGDDSDIPPLNKIFAWDSDRYLRSTFLVVARYFKPDVLVYLGDLMDEGSIATIPQFHQYAKRLFGIFELVETPSGHPLVQIWLPGDNDIGGENEPIKSDKVSEFHKIFDQPSVITHNNISFYKVNGITHEYPKQAEGTGDYRIVVSHYPVTSKHVFGQQVNKEIQPDIYFCAHEHESKYVKQALSRAHRETHSLTKEVLRVEIKQASPYEVFVPTCSYRMGTFSIGYGAAVIDHNTRELRYTVFWSPGRFPFLIFYAVILAIAVVYSIVFWAARLIRRAKQLQTKWSNDKIPLLM